jgi:hypothetical protein
MTSTPHTRLFEREVDADAWDCEGPGPVSRLKFSGKLILISATITTPINPCKTIKVAAVLRGLSRARRWVPTTEEVAALLGVVPARFQAAIWLGPAEGARLGEVLGMEAGPRCVDPAAGELHVVQHLRHHARLYGSAALHHRARPSDQQPGLVALVEPLAACCEVARGGHLPLARHYFATLAVVVCRPSRAALLTNR